MKKYLGLSFCLLVVATVFGQAGIGTTSPTSWLDVRGGAAAAIRSFTGSTTAGVTDETLIFTGTSAVNLNLPDASTCTGRVYWIKNASATLPTPAVTINPSASQTIEGGAWWLLDEQNEVVRLASNGTGWNVYADVVPVYKTATTGTAWKEGGNTLKALKTLGTTSNYDLSFLTNNTERMHLATTGFLGVGTSTPVGRLHFVSQNDDAGDDYIFADYTTTTTPGIYVRKSRGTLSAAQDLQQGDAIAQLRFSPHYNGQVQHPDGSGLDAYYQGNGTSNLSDLRFFTSNTEQMRINENGKTGIGTSVFDASNPEKLAVNAGNTNSYNLISGKGSLDNYLQLNIQNQSNTANASSDVVATAANGNETGYFIDMGINAGTFSNSSLPILSGSNTAYLYSTANDFVIGNSSAGQNLLFFSGGYATTNEGIRITATGNVGIGTTTPADMLDVAGALTPAGDNSYSLGNTSRRWSAVYAVNGTIQTSDRRLKTNIRPLDYGLAELQRLKPVRYHWQDKTTPQAKIGLIAQDLQGVVPEVVVGQESREHLGVNYAELIPVLIQTLHEQQTRLETLKQRLSQLDSQP